MLIYKVQRRIKFSLVYKRLPKYFNQIKYTDTFYRFMFDIKFTVVIMFYDNKLTQNGLCIYVYKVMFMHCSLRKVQPVDKLPTRRRKPITFLSSKLNSTTFKTRDVLIKSIPIIHIKSSVRNLYSCLP